MVRRILHIDMDAFYASVEQRDQGLAGRAVAVGGSRMRGVVTAASYEARRFGVRSAMSMREAVARCPDLVVVPPRMDRYREVSEQVRSIFGRYAERIEPLSLDEAYLDVTDIVDERHTATEVARVIKAAIRAETRLTASAGVAPCKSVAKMASKYRKPDGLTVVPPAKVQLFLDRLRVEQLHGVGPATARRLHEMGVKTGFDLRALSHAQLVERFGRSGDWYYRLIRGDDDRPVGSRHGRRSVSSERTFFDGLRSPDAIRRVVVELADRVSRRLARYGLGGRTVTVKVRYADFSEFTRSRTVLEPCASGEALVPLASRLIEDVVGSPPVRLLGLGVSNLQSKDGGQLSLAI